MVLTVLLAAIQFAWSYDDLQFNKWCNTPYYQELFNFIYILFLSVILYLFGLLLHPSSEDLKMSKYQGEVSGKKINELKTKKPNTQSKITFLADLFYQSNKINLYKLIIMYLLITLLSNKFNIYSKDSFVVQFIFKLILVLIISFAVILEKYKGKYPRFVKIVDILIPFLCIITLLIYLTVVGESNYNKMQKKSNASKQCNN